MQKIKEALVVKINMDEKEKLEQLKLNPSIAKKNTDKIYDTLKENNLSLNQAIYILDSVKEILVNKPLWSSR
ncbi:hypothetical protein HMPREF1084_01768 [Clostridium butyricum 60E.3]|nr:hypothetical protein HMPREF1084_01768 [Clostridium butyricum 60E.3]DAJ73810.1 MAG TPA: hypothetical protein [Caudoviricetes sp.]